MTFSHKVVFKKGVKKTWQLVDQFPPYLVRCVARRRIGSKQIQAMSDSDLAILSQIPLERVVEIYDRANWDEVTVGEMRRFCSACDFDPENAMDRNRLNAYKNQRGGPKFTYLKKSPWWGSVFKPLILKYFNEGNRKKEEGDYSSARQHDARSGSRRQAEARPHSQTHATVR